MKILVPGDLSRLKKYKRFECRKCGCVAIADNTEYRDISSQHEGVMFVAVCPCCGSSVYNYSYDYVNTED